MKKIIKTLLIVMVIAMAVMALASCEQDPCKDGHTMEAIGEKLATCTENGYSSGVVCSVCGYVERNSFVLEAKGHSMSDATCTDPSTCKVCGHVEGEALGHAFTVDVEALEPTCAADGYTAHKACERGCGETEGKETVPATGAHEYTVEVEAVDPTCVSAGHNAYHACECGAKGEDYVEIPASEDYHNFDENELFYYPEPTCTTPGYIAGYCTGCGKGFLLAEAPATGHVDEDADGICDVCAGSTHVNALIVGEENKIVITDALNNGYGYYITWVLFTADEAATYTFAGEGLTIWIFDATGTTLLCGMTGTANLEPGTYAICLAVTAAGETGEFTATVTKTVAAAE